MYVRAIKKKKKNVAVTSVGALCAEISACARALTSGVGALDGGAVGAV
jgi:hypothetical protein